MGISKPLSLSNIQLKILNMVLNYLDPNKGLSMTDASSISNLCNQKATDLKNKLNKATSYEETFKHGEDTFIKQQGVRLPEDTKDILDKIGELHSLQSFIMEGLKEKSNILLEIEDRDFEGVMDTVDYPQFIPLEQEPMVGEEWALNKLTYEEKTEYLENLAKASAIGSFIHAKGKLTSLRKEALEFIPTSFVEISTGVKTPTSRVLTHTPDTLSEIHEDLVKTHRKFESKVNYYKAKMLNLTTDENARRGLANAEKAEEVNLKNSELRRIYAEKQLEAKEKYQVELAKFRSAKESDKKTASALKIKVPDSYTDLLKELKG